MVNTSDNLYSSVFHGVSSSVLDVLRVNCFIYIRDSCGPSISNGAEYIIDVYRKLNFKVNCGGLNLGRNQILLNKLFLTQVIIIIFS